MRTLGFLLALLAATAQARTRVLAPHTIVMERQPDASFNPSALEVRVGDTGEFTNLPVGASVVPVGTATANACDAENAIPVTYDDDGVAIGPIGPLRKSWSGLTFRGPGGTGTGGPEVVTCAPGSGCDPNPCDIDPSPTIVGDKAYCGGQIGVDPVLPDEVWDQDGMRAELIILNWNEIETCPSSSAAMDDPCWHDDDFTAELDKAFARGKGVWIAVRAGGEGTPTDWIFDSPTSCTELLVEGNNEGEFNSGNSCGVDYSVGSVADPCYQDRILRVIDHLGVVANSRGEYRQAVAGVQLMGFNTISDELKFIYSCPDDYRNTCADGGAAPGCTSAGNGHSIQEHDGILDSYSGDRCKCNVKMMVDNGYRPSVFWAFEEVQVARWESAFWPGVTQRLALIQGGFPRVEDSPTAVNYQGDSLRDQDGNCLYDPDGDNNCTENTADDNRWTNSIRTLETLISRLRTAIGYALWVMHYGLGRYPTEDVENPAATNCSWGGTVDLLSDPPGVDFPIPLVGGLNSEPNCPNPWAAETGTSNPPYIMGLQTNNEGNGVDSPEAIISTFWNLLRNTNGVEEDIYAQKGWEIGETYGSSGDIDPSREIPGDPETDPEVAGSFSLDEFNQMLRDRRDYAPWNAAVGEENPDSFTYTFTAADVGTITIYDPSVCNDGTPPTATITVGS